MVRNKKRDFVQKTLVSYTNKPHKTNRIAVSLFSKVIIDSVYSTKSRTWLFSKPNRVLEIVFFVRKNWMNQFEEDFFEDFREGRWKKR